MDRDKIETFIRVVIVGLFALGLLFVYNTWLAPKPTETTPTETETAEGPEAEPDAEPGEADEAEKAPEETPPEEKPDEEEPPEQVDEAAEGDDETDEEALEAPELVAVGVAEGAEAEPVAIGSDAYGGAFDLEVVVQSEGAGVRRVAIARHRYFEKVDDRYEENPNEREAMELVDEKAAFAAFLIPELSLQLEGRDVDAKVDLSKVRWRLRREGPTTVVAEVDVRAGDGRPVLTVRKTLTVRRPADWEQPAEDRDPSKAAYDMDMKLEFVPSDAADAVAAGKLRYTLQGPPALPREGVRRDMRTVTVGLWAGKGVAVERIAAGSAEPEGTPVGGADQGPPAWGGVEDKYFAILAVPADREDDRLVPPAEQDRVEAAEVFAYTSEGGETRAGLRMRTSKVRLGAAPLVHRYMAYAGPKDSDVLENEPYTAFHLAKAIQWTQCCCDIPGVAYISQGLTFVLKGIHAVVRNYGVAIVILVIMLRMALHPITKWSTRSMTKMKKMQPKMQELREKYGDDKQRLNQEMMKMWKEEGVSPVGGCLPMLLQMPIWIGLYGALNASLELRHAAFIPTSWLPAGSVFLQDLAQPDKMIQFGREFSIPLISGMTGPIESLNILPLLMGVSMFLQQRLNPASSPSGPQAGQQKMMLVFMPVFLLIILYNAPAGLCLYIFTSSMLGFAEQQYLRHKFEHEGEEGGEGGGGEPPSGSGPPRKKRKKASAVKGRKRSLAERIRGRIAPDAD